jgi:hypothetical protein
MNDNFKILDNTFTSISDGSGLLNNWTVPAKNENRIVEDHYRTQRSVVRKGEKLACVTHYDTIVEVKNCLLQHLSLTYTLS